VQAGAFLIKGNVTEVAKKVRRLGYEPQLTTVSQMVDMTRLRIGSFTPADAKAKVQELKSQGAPDAFSIPSGEQVNVYAASFYELDKARSFADQLYAKDIRLDEETVRVKVPLTLLSFGNFPDRATAEKAAVKARAAGLDATVAGRP
jgi:cell division septation protein DedD